MSHGESFQVVKGVVPDAAEKQRLYRLVRLEAGGLLDSEDDPVSLMSSLIAVLHHRMPHYFWTGFYRVRDGELRSGPYQGTPACLRIRRGAGVCGTAWAEERAVVVADVHAFPGHIPCDARSMSEIVVPWRDRSGAVCAVLDVDSTLPGAFDEIDLKELGELAARWPLPSP